MATELLCKCLESFNGQNLVMLKAHWQVCRVSSTMSGVLSTLAWDLELLWGRFLKDMVISWKSHCSCSPRRPIPTPDDSILHKLLLISPKEL